MRLKPFDVKMYYYKRTWLSNVEEEVCRFRYTRLDDMMKHCDIIRADSVETIRVIIASTNVSLPVRTGSAFRVWTQMRSGREDII
jgi:hypothetical protein